MAYIEFGILFHRISDAGLLRLSAVTSGLVKVRRADDFPSAPEPLDLTEWEQATSVMLRELVAVEWLSRQSASGCSKDDPSDEVEAVVHCIAAADPAVVLSVRIVEDAGTWGARVFKGSTVVAEFWHDYDDYMRLCREHLGEAGGRDPELLQAEIERFCDHHAAKAME